MLRDSWLQTTFCDAIAAVTLLSSGEDDNTSDRSIDTAILEGPSYEEDAKGKKANSGNGEGEAEAFTFSCEHGYRRFVTNLSVQSCHIVSARRIRFVFSVGLTVTCSLLYTETTHQAPLGSRILSTRPHITISRFDYSNP